MMNVKVGKMPGTIKKVSLTAGATVGQAIREAGLDTAGYEVRVNGNVTNDMSMTVADGNIVLLVQKIKGNMPLVTFQDEAGNELNMVAVEDGTTLESAFAMAGYDYSDVDVVPDETELVGGDFDSDAIAGDTSDITTIYNDLTVIFPGGEKTEDGSDVAAETPRPILIANIEVGEAETPQPDPTNTVENYLAGEPVEGDNRAELAEDLYTIYSKPIVDVDTTGDNVLISIVTSKAVITIIAEK